jgi:hypothetical protein
VHVRHPAGPPTEATSSRPVLVAAASPDFVRQSFSEAFDRHFLGVGWGVIPARYPPPGKFLNNSPISPFD